jgi:hypothetical protein
VRRDREQRVNGWIVVAVVLVAVVLAFGLYLSMTAGRLDHLHRRIDTSTLALDAQLLRRSSVAVELASAQVLDPASGMLIADAAHRARQAADLGPEDRALAESDLTAALLATLEPEDLEEVRAQPMGAEMLDELAAAGRRVQLTRRFHNDAVRACRQVRRQRMVRLFRLAGHTPWPETWEMDDSMPEGLGTR